MNKKYRPKISDGISFVMPAFNCEKTITESIYSIINDNYEPNDELIIVNDGSNDGTLKIIKDLQKKYPFINIINNPTNKGCPASRNIGIRCARNKLIFNLDSDDILAPNSVRKLKKYLVDNSADVAAFGESHFFTNSIKNVTHKWIIKSGLFTLENFLAGKIIPGGNFIYTKSSWKKIGGYWEYGRGLHEFWGFELKQIASGSKFVIMPNSYYYHRYGHNSLYVVESKEKYRSSLMATKMIRPYIHLLHPKDAAYIKSDHGSKHWFENLNSHPIRLKSGRHGETGKIEYTKLTLCKKLIPRFDIKHKVILTLMKLISIGTGKIKYQKFYKNLFRLSLRGMNIGTGADFLNDGELNVLHHIKKQYSFNEHVVIFDVGANIGNYSQKIVNEFINVNFQLYSLEPSREPFFNLNKRFKNNPNLRLYNIGLGNRNTVKTLFYNKNKSGLSSVYNRRLSHFGIEMNLKESIELRTLDSFCEERKIKRIDFLKLDVEGNEFKVLEGAKKMIENNAITFIQFEFGGCNIDSRIFFQDFWYLLSPKYRIYRILKDNFVEISEYEEVDEIFLTTNYLATLK